MATTCGANRHPFCTTCTGWLGVEDSSGAPAEMYTTTFSSALPGPTTRSSLFGGVEYIFARPGAPKRIYVVFSCVSPPDDFSAIPGGTANCSFGRPRQPRGTLEIINAS